MSPPELLVKYGAVKWPAAKEGGVGFLSSIFGKKNKKIKKPVEEDMQTSIR